MPEVSFAGQQLVFNDPRSVLFFEFVNILNHIKKLNLNVKFLLENVRMAQAHESINQAMERLEIGKGEVVY